MATMTMPHTATAIEPKIKMAMENIGLGERADESLDMALKESLEQFERGETTTVEEMRKRTTNLLYHL
jgi:hypothetical protein